MLYIFKKFIIKSMEDIRTEYVDDDNREALIKHWEITLNNASHAVYVAQQQLEKLYRARYALVDRSLGAVAINSVVNDVEGK